MYCACPCHLAVLLVVIMVGWMALNGRRGETGRKVNRHQHQQQGLCGPRTPQEASRWGSPISLIVACSPHDSLASLYFPNSVQAFAGVTTPCSSIEKCYSDSFPATNSNSISNHLLIHDHYPAFLKYILLINLLFCTGVYSILLQVQMQNVSVLLIHRFYISNSFAIHYTLTGNVITVYWAQNTSLETILPFFFFL